MDFADVVHHLKQLTRAITGNTINSPLTDAAFYRSEAPKEFTIPTYDRSNLPEWIGADLAVDAVLPRRLMVHGTTESDLVRAIYPVLAEILNTTDVIKLVNSETDVFLPVPDESDLYNKPDLHLIHPALYCQSKQTVNGMVFGKPDANCLNGIIALLEAKLTPLSDKQVGVLMRYLSYWFNSVKRNVSGIVFNSQEFVYCEMAGGYFNFDHFIRCPWNAPGSRALLRKLLLDITVKPTEAMAINELCARLSVRVSAVPGTSYLGRGAEATVLRVTELNDETTTRALKYFHGADHIRQCQTMCTRTSDLILRVPAVAQLIIAPLGVPAIVTVDRQYSASGVLIERVGKPVTAKDFASRRKKQTLFVHLRALHELGIVHGDARLQNIVDVGVDNNVELKWIDLGHNSELSPELAVADFVTLLESYNGRKFANLDPEIFQGYAVNPYDERVYEAMVLQIMTLV